eukprot:m.74023 g.74023  ORF g.74023 m.74023 type:complete len:68 (-) comp8436_c0_seq1:420-623(-)
MIEMNKLFSILSITAVPMSFIFDYETTGLGLKLLMEGVMLFRCQEEQFQLLHVQVLFGKNLFQPSSR